MSMKLSLKILIRLGFILALPVFSGCDSNENVIETPTATDQRTELSVAGSTFASPFFNRVLEAWGQKNPNLKPVYRSIGSGAGIEEFIAGTTDIGTTDAPLNAAESARLKEDISEIIVTSGMISIAYHLDDIDDTIKLPREVYPDIFLGKITRWDDPRIAAANPGLKLPPKFIQVVARADSSGTTYAFTHHLSSISQSWKVGLGAAKTIDWPGSTMTAPGNEGVAQRLAITKYSIGYVEYGFAHRMGLKTAKLENQAGKYVLPSLDAGEEGLSGSALSSSSDLSESISDPEGDSSYPIVAYTWALLHQRYNDPDKDLAVRNLIKWSLTEGQTLAKPLMYLPLSQQIVQAGLNKLGG
ncbi:MAG: phosphate ABC transporter substrate-binding protein PstS [Ketobacter sp.]|nr:MAG: phosphate ABC transporter substrate-binding protein PstS [Ketobacter sp.]